MGGIMVMSEGTQFAYALDPSHETQELGLSVKGQRPTHLGYDSLTKWRGQQPGFLDGFRLRYNRISICCPFNYRCELKCSTFCDAAVLRSTLSAIQCNRLGSDGKIFVHEQAHLSIRKPVDIASLASGKVGPHSHRIRLGICCLLSHDCCDAAVLRMLIKV